MGLNDTVRREIRKESRKPCCLPAFLSGVIRGVGELNFTFKGFGLSFRHTDGAFIALLSDMIFSVTGERLLTSTAYLDLGCAKGEYSVLHVPVETASDLLEKCEIVKNRCEFVDVLSKNLIGKTCCKKSFLQGLFLACGYLSVPEDVANGENEGKTRAGYSLEFNLNSEIVAEEIRRLIEWTAQLSEDAVSTRKKGNRLYVKSAENISGVLAAMGSSTGAMEVHRIAIDREMKNRINRVQNFDLANIDKALSAGERQLNDIRRIEETMELDLLPANLAETCRMRKAYPDVGLAELGQMFFPPVGKSCINHRFRKLAEIALQCGSTTEEKGDNE